MKPSPLDGAVVKKRSKSSFFFFSDVQRPKVKAEHPNHTMADVARELSRRWKELNADEKAPFTRLANEDKERVDAIKKEAGIQPRAKVQVGKRAPPPGWRRITDKTLDREVFIHTSTKSTSFRFPTAETVPADLLIPPVKKEKQAKPLYEKTHMDF